VFESGKGKKYLASAETGSGSHTDSYPKGTGAFRLGSKAVGA
jgi:hypothetical protein